MEYVYIGLFGILALFAAVLETTKKTSAVDNSSKDFLRFKNNYVLVYALMMGASSVSCCNLFCDVQLPGQCPPQFS